MLLLSFYNLSIAKAQNLCYNKDVKNKEERSNGKLSFPEFDKGSIDPTDIR